MVPLSQIKAGFPVLKNPANRHRAVGLTYEQWHYAFTNTFSEEESRRLYERYHVPASGAIFWGSALANIHPGHDDTYVDYKNDDRAPLLFISGSEDHLMPPKIQRSNAKHYKSDTVTEVKEYEGYAHLLPAQEGWEEIADDALDWALSHAVQPSSAVTGRAPHAHRRADGPDRGRRLAAPDRPDLRPAGRQVLASAGARARARSAGPSIPAAELGDDRRGAAEPRPPRRQPRRRPGARCCRPRAWWSPPRRARERLGGGARGLAPWATTGSRRRDGRRSRSPPRPAATARR